MKNISHQLFLVACIAGLLLSGCAPVYVSNRLNSPLFDDGGQANLGIGYGVDGLSLNGAVSPVKSLAFIGNYSHVNRNGDYGDEFNHSIMEVGVGFFGSNPLNSENQRFFYEGFLGYGLGKSDAIDKKSGGGFYEKSKGEYRQFFVQPSLGYRINRFALAGSARLNFINFSQLSITKGGDPSKTYNNLRGNSFALAGTLYGWFDPVRIGLQLGFSLLGQSQDESVVLDYNPLIFNLSFEYTLRSKKRAPVNPIN